VTATHCGSIFTEERGRTDDMLYQATVAAGVVHRVAVDPLLDAATSD
jgi:hypothetical protein